ncbi:hypothetical protein [Nocardiopsis sp. YSL2]|uniref:hypothetical protein n=1 Tax=Nocardiopsis sp. YSL2 TaxID=2939492 RepID=UPI0026F43F9F|nr:hypothetical protein [Nocardiopsis sp. YSL2]
MDIAPPHVIRTLRYIRAVTANGGLLREWEVDAFAHQQPPKAAQYGLAGLRSLRRAGWAEVRTAEPEPVAAYLDAVGWTIDGPDGVELTPLGLAVLKAHADQGEEDVVDVALDPDNPLSIVNLIGRIHAAGAGMIVDPYFKTEMLKTVCDSTTVKRILLSSKNSTRRRPENDLLGYALHQLQDADPPEIRHTEDPRLHDRFILDEGGRLSMIGGSINGVGKVMTAIVTPSEEIQRTFRELCEDLWESATPIDPAPPTQPPTQPEDTPS